MKAVVVGWAPRRRTEVWSQMGVQFQLRAGLASGPVMVAGQSRPWGLGADRSPYETNSLHEAGL